MQLLQCVGYMLLIVIAALLVDPFLPRGGGSDEEERFVEYPWEEKLYQFLRVQRWKDHMPDMSRVTPWLKTKKPGLPLTLDDVEKLIAETRVAESVHWVLYGLAMGCIVIWPGMGGLLTALLAGFAVHMPFIIIQRYNRPRLIVLRDRMKKRTYQTSARRLGYESAVAHV